MPKASTLLKISLYAFAFLFTESKISVAQVTSDNTVNTQINQNGNVAEITRGETRGDNLFHSFESFSVPINNEAFFNNANNISNIFSRVTGGNISNIDGLISANGIANLFLINPAGIIFGEGARLDLGGSFYGSSASSILFEEGEFSADLDTPPLLTVNAPIGLSFRDNPGEITNRSVAEDVGLQVSPGETIGLIGGNVKLAGGLITAPGGLVELGGLIEGTIGIADDGSLSFPNDVAKANISFDSAVVKGGSIRVNANSLEFTGEGLLVGGIGQGLGSVDAVAGTIQIDRIVEPEQTIVQACNANREIAAKNSFEIKGKGGIPPAPESPLNSANITIDGSSSDTSSIPKPIATSEGKIQPARGIKLTKSGVTLTAYRTSNSGDRNY